MAAITTLTLDCGELRIEFQRVNDRWEHTVGLVDAQGFNPWARSVEGTAEDLWPASPALQELHIEDRTNGQVAFLTGMAGSSHWSASIACEPAQNRATFDIACRCKEPPSWLGSLYQMPEAISVRHEESRAELKQPPSSSGLIVSTENLIGSVPQFPPERKTPWTDVFTETVKSLRQTILVSPSTAKAGTIRWIYSIAPSMSE